MKSSAHTSESQAGGNFDLIDRLAKLLRLACSNGPDGEKLAALAKLFKAVRANDLDWNYLLGRTANDPELTRENLQKVYQAGIEAGVAMERAAHATPARDWATAGRPRTDEVGSRASDLKVILLAAELAEADGALNGWLAQFAADMRARLWRWGAETYVSDRQWEVINRLQAHLEFLDYLE
jgi:hypothetical protein